MVDDDKVREWQTRLKDTFTVAGKVGGRILPVLAAEQAHLNHVLEYHGYSCWTMGRPPDLLSLCTTSCPRTEHSSCRHLVQRHGLLEALEHGVAHRREHEGLAFAQLPNHV